MDEIEVQSSQSEVSSCSNVTYEGTDGYITEGEDPFFLPPPNWQGSSDDQLSDDTQQSQEADQQQQQVQTVKTEQDFQKMRVEREKKKQVKQIMDEIKYGRNTTLLLNRHPLVPTYEQVTKTIELIRKKFPRRSLPKIITMLHNQLIVRPKQLQKKQLKAQQPQTIIPEDSKQREEWIQQRRVAAMAFCDIGFGITRMRKFIQLHGVNVSINITTYDVIMKKLLLDGWKRLQRFLSRKCHKKIKRVRSEVEERFLLEALKNCRTKLDAFEIHNFFKLIRLTYDTQKQKISKRIASRLYHSGQDYIMRKKIKAGLMDPDNPQSEIYNDDKAKWTPQMGETALNLYIKEPSLNRVREIMIRMYAVEEYMFDNRNIKHHLAIRIKIAIKRLQQLKIQGLRKMVELDETKIGWLFSNIQATSVRVCLCQIYATPEPTLTQLNQTILAVNEFILKRQNEEMLQQQRRTQKEYDPHEQQFRKRRRAKRR